MTYCKPDINEYDVLRATKELLKDPKNWTQGKSARDVNSVPCEPSSPQATCWCLTGAAYKVSASLFNKSNFSENWLEALHLLQQVVPGGWIGPWNDAKDRTHAEVLNMIDLALDQEPIERS